MADQFWPTDHMFDTPALMPFLNNFKSFSTFHLQHLYFNKALLPAELNMVNKYDVANWQTGLAPLTSTKAPVCDLLFKHIGEAAACVQFGQPSVDELQP